jgi:hypothetical protein
MNTRAVNITWAVALAAVLAGCASKPRESEEPDGQKRRTRTDAPREREWRIERPPPTTTQTSSTPLPVDVQPTLVKRGLAPLVYIVETAANVSVVDLDTGQRLAGAPVGARTIVRIEARTGVVFGEQRVAPGPLPADHQYGIYVESGQASEIRQETVSPAPREQRQQQQQPQPRSE